MWQVEAYQSVPHLGRTDGSDSMLPIDPGHSDRMGFCVFSLGGGSE